MDAVRQQLESALGTRYLVHRELEGAGMARVFLAEERGLGRRVVIKTLPAAAGEVNAERFRREIGIVAALQHPNIVPLLEGGATGELLYYTMPFVEGLSLRDRLEQEHELPVAEAVTLLRELGDALAYAHEQSVVHRDLKPENVLLSHGHALLADFGVARALASALPDADRLTATGTSLGTPRYMAPEQALGEPGVDHRADLYALGLIAYEMLAGSHPFAGRSAAALVAAHISSQPDSLSSRRPTVPRRLESLVMRLLEKRPADRPSSARQVVRELETISAVSRSEVETGEHARSRRPSFLRVGAVLALAIAATVLGYSVWRRGSTAAAAPAQPGIAVLPFENIGGDTAAEYFSDGITEELLNALTRIDGLRVAGRTSSFAFKGKRLDARSIGDTLGVTTLLAGSVRRAGDRLRVRAELVDTRNGYTLWSDTYERPIRDVFAVQDEISRAIVERLRLRLPARATTVVAQGEPRLDAYDLYLRGRFYWNRRTEEGLNRSVDLFTQSIQRDSTFALAHAALADAYNVIGTYNFMPPNEALPRARAAAQRALALDSTLAEAHAALGFVSFWHDRDWPDAEREFQRAIALKPSYATAHHWYSLMLSVRGRHEEAIAEISTALELDPLSPIISTILGTRFLFAGQLQNASRQLEQTREMHPTYALAHFWLAQTRQYLGDSAGALAAAHTAVANDSGNAMMHLGLARLLAVEGQRADARRMLSDVESRFAGRFSRVHVAWVYAALGDADTACRWLENAYENRDGWLHNLAVDPAFAAIRDDQRVQQLLRRLRLPAWTPPRS